MPTRRAGEGVPAPEPKWVLIQESPESCSPVGSSTALIPLPGLSPPWPTAWWGLASHLCLSRGAGWAQAMQGLLLFLFPIKGLAELEALSCSLLVVREDSSLPRTAGRGGGCPPTSHPGGGLNVA